MVFSIVDSEVRFLIRLGHRWPYEHRFIIEKPILERHLQDIVGQIKVKINGILNVLVDMSKNVYNLTVYYASLQLTKNV